MARIVVELTNRCNLNCAHCYLERHARTGDLPWYILDRVFREARACGIDHVTYTGGEPALYLELERALAGACEGGCTFSMVSNGTRFQKVFPLFLKYRAGLTNVTFSMDGARPETHDRLRGEGSFRDVARAAMICVARDVPFTFNMVLTAANRSEPAEMIRLAERLGAAGVRFGHLMPGSGVPALQLSAAEKRAVEQRIWQLRESSRVAVAMAAGYFSEQPLFPCAPLRIAEYNLDYLGNVTLCCQLSGHSSLLREDHSIGNLHEITLAEACTRFQRRVDAYIADKQRRIREVGLSELEHFPCHYCVKYVGGELSQAGEQQSRGSQPAYGKALSR